MLTGTRREASLIGPIFVVSPSSRSKLVEYDTPKMRFSSFNFALPQIETRRYCERCNPNLRHKKDGMATLQENRNGLNNSLDQSKVHWVDATMGWRSKTLTWVDADEPVIINGRAKFSNVSL